MIDLKSGAFDDNTGIPRRYTKEGDDVSPPLSWQGLPEETRELVLICEDPDAPQEEPFIHWVLYGIDPDTTQLEENDSTGALEGKNSFGDIGYGGPMPPAGHGLHHYHFRLFAVNKKLDLGPGADSTKVYKEIKGHVLDMGELVGTYERKE